MMPLMKMAILYKILIKKGIKNYEKWFINCIAKY